MRLFTLSLHERCQCTPAVLIDPEVGVMRPSLTLAAAILSAIALTTAWLDVAQGQGCYGGNPTAGFEQFNAAALGRVVPAG